MIAPDNAPVNKTRFIMPTCSYIVHLFTAASARVCRVNEVMQDTVTIYMQELCTAAVQLQCDHSFIILCH